MPELQWFLPDRETVERANITAYMRTKGFTDYGGLWRWSVAEKEAFWAEMAQELHWFEPWRSVLDWQPPHAHWFAGGKTNICYNALDRHIAAGAGDRVAFYWEGEPGDRRTLTYGELYRDVNRLAASLAELGIGAGDRVVMYLPRIPEVVTAMLALARLGAVHSVVHTGFSLQALRQRLTDWEAKAVITADGYYHRGKLVPLKPLVDAAVAGTGITQHVIVVRRAGNEVPWQEGRDLDWAALLDRPFREVPCLPVASEHELFSLYTSGTTGSPKGIVHGHGGYQVGVYATSRFVLDLKPDDVLWCTADPGWITGQSYGVYGPMLLGVTQVMYEGSPTEPDPGRVWAILERYRVSVLYTAPTAVRGLMRFGLDWPQRHDLSHLRLVGAVGEPLNPEAWHWIRLAAGRDIPVIDTWWQTETGQHMVAPVPILPLKPGSPGLPFLGIEADVVDREGRAVPAGTPGYLVVRQPWPAMLQEVYGDPSRFDQYWQSLPGFYFSGDAATRDADGYFWIHGRTDDVIKKAGYRIGPMEIESVLLGHPLVREAAVIGKPDPLTGQRIKAFVTLQAGAVPSHELAETLRSYVRDQIGSVADPDEVEFTADLPKTRSGKVSRRLLKERETGTTS